MGDFESIDDLPTGVVNSLPKQAQEIYMEAHNKATDEYSGSDEVEQIAHRMAWAAVKQKYEKLSQGTWHKKDTP